MSKEQDKAKRFALEMAEDLWMSVVGQSQVLRAVSVAVAGNHSIAFVGQHGSGRRHMARLYDSLRQGTDSVLIENEKAESIWRSLSTADQDLYAYDAIHHRNTNPYPQRFQYCSCGECDEDSVSSCPGSDHFLEFRRTHFYDAPHIDLFVPLKRVVDCDAYHGCGMPFPICIGQIALAVARQRNERGCNNGQMLPYDSLRLMSKLTHESAAYLRAAVDIRHLLPGDVLRVLRVALTIEQMDRSWDDTDDKTGIRKAAVKEALSYRGARKFLMGEDRKEESDAGDG